MIKLALYPEILKNTNEIKYIDSHITRLLYNEYRYKDYLEYKNEKTVLALVEAFTWRNTKLDPIFWALLDYVNTYQNIYNFKPSFLFKSKLYYYD